MEIIPRLTLTLALLFCSSQATAILIDEGNVTHDNVSNLLWLDLTQTTSMSYFEVQESIQNPTSSLFGWQIASRLQVYNLFSDFEFGFAPELGAYSSNTKLSDSDYLVERAKATQYLSLFGHTTIRYSASSRARMSGMYGPSSTSTGRVSYSDVHIINNFYWEDEISTRSGNTGLNDKFVARGTYLVKSSILSVPEPSSLILLSIGILGLLSRKYT